MKIHLDQSETIAGAAVTGRVVPIAGQSLPSNVVLVQSKRTAEVDDRQEVKSAPVDPDTGEFGITVPSYALPTALGSRIRIRWSVAVTTASRTAESTLIVRRDPDRYFRLAYEAGDTPTLPPDLRRRGREPLGMGVIMFFVFAFGFFFLEQASRDASSIMRVIALGAMVVAMLASVATALLAAGMMWPRSIGGFEATIEPPLVDPGGVVTVTSAQQVPADLHLVCVETHGDIVERHHEHGMTTKVPVMRRFEHPRIAPTIVDGGCRFEVPTDALPSYDGPAGQITWAVRRGGRTIGEWGPFRVREWAVVVR